MIPQFLIGVIIFCGLVIGVLDNIFANGTSSCLTYQAKDFTFRTWIIIHGVIILFASGFPIIAMAIQLRRRIQADNQIQISIIIGYIAVAILLFWCIVGGAFFYQMISSLEEYICSKSLKTYFSVTLIFQYAIFGIVMLFFLIFGLCYTLNKSFRQMLIPRIRQIPQQRQIIPEVRQSN